VDGKWDKEAQDTLQEMFGYLLTSDTRQQKIFLMWWASANAPI
jgi:phage/plasmid-associated DNA primase